MDHHAFTTDLDTVSTASVLDQIPIAHCGGADIGHGRPNRSTLAAALARPPRCVLVNLTTGESIECLFNPKEFTEKLDVNWTRLTVPGLSHQVLQFHSGRVRRSDIGITLLD